MHIRKKVFFVVIAILLHAVNLLASPWQVGNCGRGVTCPEPYTATPSMTMSQTPNSFTPTPSITGTPPTPTATPTASPSPSVTLTPTLSNTPTQAPTAVPDSYQQRVVVAQFTPVTDSQGKVWNADQAYNVGSWGYTQAGTSYQSQQDAQNTSDPHLYKGFRQGSSVGYRFDVPAGSYLVTLLFCDFISQQTGQRVFNVSAQSNVMLSNVDLYTLAGNGQPYTASFVVAVSGASLDLAFSPTTGNAIVNAISVQGLQPLHSPTPTPTVTVTPTPNQTAFVIQLDRPANAILIP